MEYQWDRVTEEELKHLYYEEGKTDREIAERFGVSMGKVVYKRRKYGISIKNMIYQQFMDENPELFAQLNENSRERLLRRENIDAISKAVTHYAFRNGPVEDMHANGQLSQQDMKTLNKYMVNRIRAVVCGYGRELAAAGAAVFLLPFFWRGLGCRGAGYGRDEAFDGTVKETLTGVRKS